MKIIKGICGLVLFLCLIGIAVIPFMHEAETVSSSVAVLGLTALTLTAIIAFIGYYAAEQYSDRKIDFAEFVHQEYISGRSTISDFKRKIRNADERQLNRR